MSISFEQRCKNLITDLELGSADDVVAVTPLTGGVSSDIALVDLGNRKICVKFALEKLKVVEDWYANIERNQAEYLWLLFASSIVPEATPTLLGCSQSANGFAMEFVEGDEVYLWKKALLQVQPDTGEAEKVGDVLGRIHQASSASEEVMAGFQNQGDFHALRLEPYLCFTATRYPDLSAKINGLVDILNSNQLVLVHGDVSPKNIIFRQGVPIFLDAECATVGDPSFDVSFCLNHLILKALHLGDASPTLLPSVLNFWSAYEPHVRWEKATALEERICQLLPALMLARIDGKSPVEYLDDEVRDMVRSLSTSLITYPTRSLARFVEQITHAMESR